MAKPLSKKQLAFVEYYLTCWSETEAARRAGYANPNNNAHRLMVNDGITAAIAARLSELKMGADEVLVRLTDHARGSADDFLTIERVKRRDPQIVAAPTEDDPEAVKIVPGPEYEVIETRLDFEKVKTRGKLHLIKKISDTKYGLRVEVYDAQAALALLGRAHGIFIERTETTIDFIGDAAESLDRKLLPDMAGDEATVVHGEPEQA